MRGPKLDEQKKERVGFEKGTRGRAEGFAEAGTNLRRREDVGDTKQLQTGRDTRARGERGSVRLSEKKDKDMPDS